MDIVGRETISIDGVLFDIVQHGHQLTDTSATVEAEEVILNGDSLGYCRYDEETDGWIICDAIGLPRSSDFSSRFTVIKQMVKNASVRSLDAEATLDQWRVAEARRVYKLR